MQIRRRSPNPAIDVDILRYQVRVPDEHPRHILEKIVWHKEKEVDRLRQRLPLLELRKRVKEIPPPKDFLASITLGKTRPALIAELKKASPSKGVIREDFDPATIARSYAKGGASCLSVLTDTKFFQGNFDNLTIVRQTVNLPIMCKEFILYPYQIYLARSKGADGVLLIAAILNDCDLTYFVKIIRSLGMTSLIEVHSLEELDRVLGIEGVSLIGINNRNLETFEVDLNTTRKLLAARRDEIKKQGIKIISESGLYTRDDIQFVQQAGADGVLIGESLVKQPDPTEAITRLFF
ncbi:indole-3-glycerol phosphate synthase TrpC [Cyanobacterium sp. uoEpiScrs1]|uniref:indole-3-glycerol phosphate synthase TrpC n=1 Tax=Cyanobacterium sp. uoEpiScrs1 TaxID=2976343 RepID=UPI00226A8B8A|nr:indole-3-glycerol phosphate synthase TrpC [Cyanobacterium sp. uoEpiScrs1]